MVVERGCGTRVKGGVYAEIPLSKHGLPLESFLSCPPVVVDAQQLGLTNVGVKLIERAGVWHVFDIVGKQHYPNVADFVEEARRFGISRRLSQNLDFSKLTTDSRLILLHDHAHIDNFELYRGAHECPKVKPGHDRDPLPEMCISLWWQDLVQGEPTEETGRAVRRKMPSFEYTGYMRPENILPKYRLAIFGSFPIPKLVVVNDPEAGTHEQAFHKARNAGLPVRLVDE
jgi:hypothetical protein